jgi:sugar lactone lactonase YvrE
MQADPKQKAQLEKLFCKAFPKAVPVNLRIDSDGDLWIVAQGSRGICARDTKGKMVRLNKWG